MQVSGSLGGGRRERPKPLSVLLQGQGGISQSWVMGRIYWVPREGFDGQCPGTRVGWWIGLRREAGESNWGCQVQFLDANPGLVQRPIRSNLFKFFSNRSAVFAKMPPGFLLFFFFLVTRGNLKSQQLLRRSKNNTQIALFKTPTPVTPHTLCCTSRLLARLP